MGVVPAVTYVHAPLFVHTVLYHIISVLLYITLQHFAYNKVKQPKEKIILIIISSIIIGGGGGGGSGVLLVLKSSVE